MLALISNWQTGYGAMKLVIGICLLGGLIASSSAMSQAVCTQNGAAIVCNNGQVGTRTGRVVIWNNGTQPTVLQTDYRVDYTKPPNIRCYRARDRGTNPKFTRG